MTYYSEKEEIKKQMSEYVFSFLTEEGKRGREGRGEGGRVCLVLRVEGPQIHSAPFPVVVCALGFERRHCKHTRGADLAGFLIHCPHPALSSHTPPTDDPCPGQLLPT